MWRMIPGIQWVLSSRFCFVGMWWSTNEEQKIGLKIDSNSEHLQETPRLEEKPVFGMLSVTQPSELR